jgi:MHS family citrate/tricarballylate:H+ symporter-like MFS transporter
VIWVVRLKAVDSIRNSTARGAVDNLVHRITCAEVITDEKSPLLVVAWAKVQATCQRTFCSAFREGTLAASTIAEQEFTQRVRLPPRKVLVVGIGNALEFYDFFTFGYFAIQIGHAFFPTSAGLLLTLATYGVGFVTRPLGGFVVGRYGDRVGRKPAMLWSFGLMGLAIVGLSVIPSYSQIGMAAPVLLVIFRLLQGFAVGGEVGPSTAFLIESAPQNRRGLYVALQMATQYLAVVAAGVVGFALSAWLSATQLDAWGWRIAFLIGAAIVPVGLYLRRHLPEQPPGSASISAAPVAGSVSLRLIVLSLMMIAAGTITAYTLGYMNTYMQDTLKFSTKLAFGETILEGLSVVSLALIGGSLSDRFGRKPLMLGGLTALLLLALPGYAAIGMARSAVLVYAVSAVLNGLYGLYVGAAVVAVVESLPRSSRAGAFGILYAIGIAVFGGFTQFIIKWLIDVTGNPLAPAWYLSVALIVGGVAMTLLPESAPCANPDTRDG